MPIGKKKEEKDKFLEEIRKAVDGFNQLPENKEPEIKFDEQPTEMKEEFKPKQEFKESERPAFAPLFVKIDRYRQILNSIGYLKSTLVLIKNSLITLNELDKARGEIGKLLEGAVDKVEKKVISLDQELIRPSGYHEMGEKPEYQDVETVESTIGYLKSQIEQLKTELEQMA